MTGADTPPLEQPAFSPAPRRRIGAVWRASLSEKRAGLFAFFLSLIWPIYLTVGLGPINITPARVAAALAIVIVGLYLFAFEHRLMQYIRILRFNPVMLISFALYIFWRFLSDSGSIDPAASYILTILDIISSSFFLITLMTVAMGSTNAIVESIFWADLILITIGLVELVMRSSVAPFLIHFSSMSADQLAGYSTDIFRNDVFRVRSLSSHPILFGSFVAANMPVLLHLVRRGRRPYIRALSLVLLALSPVMLLATSARSAQAGAVIALFTFFFLRTVRAGRRNPIYLLLLFFGGAILVLGAMATSAASGGLDAASQLIAGRDKQEQSSSDARVKMLDRGINALGFQPYTGYGDGQAINIAGLRNQVTNLATIDSYYLVIALNFGYVGLAINIVLLVTILWAGFAASTKRRIQDDQGAIAALSAASVCILTCAVTVTSQEYFVVVYALGAVAAVALARPPRAFE